MARRRPRRSTCIGDADDHDRERQARDRPTKTNRSRRTVSLDPTTIEALEAHRLVQDEERAIAGEAWDRSFDLVLCGGTGRPEHPDRFSRQFQRYAGETVLPRCADRTICATLGPRSR
jgi:integrase